MKFPVAIVSGLIAGWMAACLPAQAEIRLDGYIVATRNCAALQSLRKETNPGGVFTEPGRSYVLLGKNRQAASHYLIEVENADPVRRWISVSCGHHVVPAGAAAQREKIDDKTVERGTGNILAISWQPAFCESAAGESKTECRTMAPGRFDTEHFALHGLWPQPRGRQYCDVPAEQTTLDRAGRWLDLAPMDLSHATQRTLSRVMPGTQSGLHRHEWVKHGSCYGAGDPESYFVDSLALMEIVNRSSLRQLFASNIGRAVTGDQIRSAFERDFGAEAGKRIRISCRRDGSRLLISEITIGLSGEIGPDPDLSALLAAADPTSPGCPGGIVDPPGNQ